MRYYRKKKIIIISCLAALVLSIGLGFAAFSTNLKINGSAKISPTDANFKVIFTDSAESGGVYTQLPVIPTSNPSDLEKYDGEIATEGTKISNLGGVFTEDGQSIVYDFFVYNVGKYDAYLTNIDYTYKEGTYSKRTCTNISSSESTFSESCNDIIIKVVLAGETYTGSTIFTDHVLAKGEYEPIQVIIEYPEGSDLPDGEMNIEFSDIELIFGTIDEAHQLPDAALMANGTNVFRFSGITRDQVESIETVDSIDVPYDAIDSCDASAKQDETVIAWYKDEDSNGLYELYIGGEGIIKVTSGEYLFASYTNAKKIDLSHFDTSNVTNMNNMFTGCNKLENVDISNFTGDKVTTMEGMFYGCSNLQSLSLNNFSAPYLTNIWSMLSNCSNLKKLEMNNFRAPILRNMVVLSGFSGFESWALINVETISMKNLYLPSVENMSCLFYNHQKLASIDLSGAEIGSTLKDISNMFLNCYKLKEIDMSGFDTSNVENMSALFGDCKELETINISSLNTSNVINMAGMFYGCKSITSLNLSHFDTSKVTTMESMFDSCTKLENIDISNFTGDKVTTMEGMFYGCSNLQSLSLNNFSAPYLTNIWSMLSICSNLKKLEMNNFRAPILRNMVVLSGFSGFDSWALINVETISMKNLYLPSVENMSYLFYNHQKLASIDLSGAEIGSTLKDISNMFLNCYKLKEIDMSGFDTSNVENMSALFGDCKELETINISSLNTSNVINMAGMFYGCKSITSLNLSHFDTSNVTNMNNMFAGCSRLENVDISNFTGDKVTTMEGMFYGCSNLQSLSLNNFSAPYLTNIRSMLSICSNLKKLEMNNFRAPILRNMVVLSGFSGFESWALINVETISMKNLYLPSVENMSCLFYNHQKLASIDLSGAEIGSTLNDISNMFRNCPKLRNVNLSGIDLTSKTSYQKLILEIPNNKEIIISDTEANRTFMNTNFSNFTNITWI